jgi:hypothetical protein
MRFLGLAVGMLVILGGAICVVAPETLLSLVRPLVSTAGLYAIAAVRIALGLALMFAARESRAPRAIRVVGAIVISAGFATPFFGVERTRDVLNWGSGPGLMYLRLAACIAIALGGFLVYAFRSPAPTAAK